MTVELNDKTPLLLPRLTTLTHVIEVVQGAYRFFVTDSDDARVLIASYRQNDPYDKAVTHFTTYETAQAALQGILRRLGPTVCSLYRFAVLELPGADEPIVYTTHIFDGAKPGDYVLQPHGDRWPFLMIAERGCIHRDHPGTSCLVREPILMKSYECRVEAIHWYQHWGYRTSLLHEYHQDGTIYHRFRIGPHGLVVSASAPAVGVQHDEKAGFSAL